MSQFTHKPLRSITTQVNKYLYEKRREMLKRGAIDRNQYRDNYNKFCAPSLKYFNKNVRNISNNDIYVISLLNN